MRDFPAPVSPVITFNPGRKRAVRVSITANWVMRSSLSMLRFPSSILRYAPPVELRAEDFIEGPVAHEGEVNFALRPPDPDHPPRADAVRILPIRGHLERHVGKQVLDL